jgi:hypothetical protein
MLGNALFLESPQQCEEISQLPEAVSVELPRLKNRAESLRESISRFLDVFEELKSREINEKESVVYSSVDIWFVAGTGVKAGINPQRGGALKKPSLR